MDNAKYLGVEHKHKEKEYGIPWRTAYKYELEKHFEKLSSKYGNPLEGNPSWAGDPNDAIFAIVLKDYKDIQTFIKGKQFDLIEMLLDNLTTYE